MIVGDEISLEQRATLRLAAANAMWAALETVETTFRLAGGGALYDHSPSSNGAGATCAPAGTFLLRHPRSDQRPAPSPPTS